MKAFIGIFLVGILVLQTANAFPHYRRYRRDAPKREELSAEGEEKRTELMEYLAREMMTMAKETVDSHKTTFEHVLEHAEKSELKGDKLKKELQKFTELVEKAKSLPAELEEEDDIVKLFELFGDCIELADKYDNIESPTEEEKLIKRLLDEYGAPRIMLEFLMAFVKVRTNYESHIQKYVDSLTDDDKAKESKFLEWFEKFKNVKGFDNYVDITMEVFDFFDDTSEEKTD